MDRDYRYVVDRDAFWHEMEAAKLQSKELAALCGVWPSYLSLITTGKRSPGAKLRERMAAALHVTEDELFRKIYKARRGRPGDRKAGRKNSRVRKETGWRPRRRATPGRVKVETRARPLKRGRKRREGTRKLPYPELPMTVE